MSESSVETKLKPKRSQKKTPWYQRTYGRILNDAQLLVLTRQLSGLIGASVPVLEAMQIVIETTKAKSAKRMLEAVAGDVRNGSSFAEAIQKHPKAFPAFYIAMLEAAEISGELAKTFDTLAEYIERSLNSKRAVRAAMYYPMVLIALAVVAVAVLAVVVLPKFVSFFAALGSSLPTSTRILISAVDFIGSFWMFIVGGGLILVLFVLLIRKTSPGRYATDKTLLLIPFFGETIKLINLERMTRMLSSLANAGVPLPDALRLTSRTLTNSVFARALERVRREMLAGQGLTAPLRETGVFPTDTVQILDVGERSGRLVEQLDHASAYYSKDVDYRLKNLTALIEPVILILVGGVVGFMAVALVSAMYGIYSSSGLQ